MRASASDISYLVAFLAWQGQPDSKNLGFSMVFQQCGDRDGSNCIPVRSKCIQMEFRSILVGSGALFGWIFTKKIGTVGDMCSKNIILFQLL